MARPIDNTPIDKDPIDKGMSFVSATTTWTRPIGGGHSSILYREGKLYTLGGGSGEEWIVALDAQSGDTLWIHRYSASVKAREPDFRGPHATPVLVGDRLVAVGASAIVHALDPDTGEVHWQRDLVKEYRCRLPQAGYASSPRVWKDRLLFAVGGKVGAISLTVSDGSLVWKAKEMKIGHASPIVFDHEEKSHVVFNGIGEMRGLDAEDGKTLWRRKLPQKGDTIAVTPVWLPDEELLITSHKHGSHAGGRAVRLKKDKGRYRASEAWFQKRFRVEHGNMVPWNGLVIGTSGGHGASLLAIEATTGKPVWEERRFGKATLILYGDSLVALKEDGTLTGIRLTREGPEDRWEHEVLSEPAWTAPTGIGRSLFLRDTENIVRVEMKANR